MRVNAIIAEYNPFHGGHSRQLEQTKLKHSADYNIVVLSGNYVQRGAPALIDKFDRTRCALLNGADLVLELPICYSASSAEYFANGAIALLDHLGVVDTLSFGSECGDIEVLKKIADILAEEPTPYLLNLKYHMSDGESYPIARTNALIQYDPGLFDYRDVLSMPNNILGISYIETLIKRRSRIEPDTDIRNGSDYHDQRLGEIQASAAAIRTALAEGRDFSFLDDQMPESAAEILKKHITGNTLMNSDDFSAALYYKLLNEKNSGYAGYFDVSNNLSDKITNSLYHYKNFTDFCNVLKSKNMTYTRISRCLLHILLDLTKERFEKCKSMDYAPYARVLGFKKESEPLLSEIKKRSDIPLITKLADAKTVLNEEAYEMLSDELRMNDIYLSTVALKTGQPMQNEISTPIVKI